MGWASILIILLFISAVRIRLLDTPLERDEGAYAYMAQLILQGIPPYVKSINVKMPGFYAAYALVMAIFGQSLKGIHLNPEQVSRMTYGANPFPESLRIAE